MSAKRWTVAGRLFQASMWREYAMTFDGRVTSWGTPPEWVKTFMPRWDRERCMRQSRVNAYLARRLNRRKEPHHDR